MVTLCLCNYVCECSYRQGIDEVCPFLICEGLGQEGEQVRLFFEELTSLIFHFVCHQHRDCANRRFLENIFTGDLNTSWQLQVHTRTHLRSHHSDPIQRWSGTHMTVHFILEVWTPMCPGPQWRTTYSADVLCRTKNSLALLSASCGNTFYCQVWTDRLRAVYFWSDHRDTLMSGLNRAIVVFRMCVYHF